MNQLFISLFISSAVSITLLLLLILMAIILQFRKKQDGFHHSVSGLRKGFKSQLLFAEVQAQEDVFRVIAREIHDSIGLSLTTIKLYLNRLIPSRNPDEEKHIKGSVGLLSRVIDQLRNISRSMNGDVLEDQGLVNALQQEIERLNQPGQLEIVLFVVGEQMNFDPVREIMVLRIIQESLNNIVKHAHARKVTITLHYTRDQLFLKIEDDGIGIGQLIEKKQQGSGLINIYKRAGLLEGTCAVTATIPHGTTLSISIPLK